MKMLSVLEIAPPLQNIFGFDLVTTDSGVYFSTQKGVPLDKVLESKSLQEIQ